MQIKTLTVPSQNIGSFSLSSITVALEHDPSSLQAALLPNDFKLLGELYLLVHKKAKKALPKIKELHEQYPSALEITNLLIFAYIKSYKLKAAELLITSNYLSHPTHLTARLNYADQCLRLKRHHEIPTIFHNTFDLQKLYPSRKVFDLNEYQSFMAIMGLYHITIDQKEIASYYHYLSHSLNANHPATRLLGRRLYKTTFWNRFKSRFR